MVDRLFKLQPGKYSEVFNNGSSLEIVKNLETNGDKIRAAHIVFNFKGIKSYTDSQRSNEKVQTYIKL
jgi:hypothetical protein